jgi:hypothetical protein
MRKLVVFCLAATVYAQAPDFQRVGTMSQLMVDVIYPTSDSIFYIEREPPKNDVDWERIRQNALTLAESANLLMIPGRARDDAKWMADAKLMLDAGAAAYRAAVARDMPALVGLNQQLYEACVTCHMDYRPNYGRRRVTSDKQKQEGKQ